MRKRNAKKCISCAKPNDFLVKVTAQKLKNNIFAIWKEIFDVNIHENVWHQTRKAFVKFSSFVAFDAYLLVWRVFSCVTFSASLVTLWSFLLASIDAARMFHVRTDWIVLFSLLRIKVLCMHLWFFVSFAIMRTTKTIYFEFIFGEMIYCVSP